MIYLLKPLFINKKKSNKRKVTRNLGTYVPMAMHAMHLASNDLKSQGTDWA